MSRVSKENNVLFAPRTSLLDRCNPRDAYAQTHIPLRDSADNLLYTMNYSSDRPEDQHARIGLRSRGWEDSPTPLRHAFSPYTSYDELDGRSGDDTSAESNMCTPLSATQLKKYDPSLRNFEFDISCLDALDDLLLSSPTDSFEEVCWAEAVRGDKNMNLNRNMPLVPFGPLQPRIRRFDTVFYDRHDFMHDDEPDPYHDWDEDLPIPIQARPRVRRLPTPPPPPFEFIDSQSPPYTSRAVSSDDGSLHQDAMLALLESRFVSYDPSESVNFFPIPSQRRAGAGTWHANTPAPSPVTLHPLLRSTSQIECEGGGKVGMKRIRDLMRLPSFGRVGRGKW